MLMTLHEHITNSMENLLYMQCPNRQLILFEISSMLIHFNILDKTIHSRIVRKVKFILG